MAKRSGTVPDSFEVDVVSLLRGQVDAIVHELAVAISDIQSGFRAEDAEDYLYGKLESLVPAMREQSARLREQQQRELKRHLHYRLRRVPRHWHAQDCRRLECA